MKLDQAICVVTGAARGIGRALASALHAEGARLILADSDAPTLQITAASLTGSTPVHADVTRKADIEAIAAQASRLGSLGVWINNAGIARHRSIVDYTESEIDLMIGVNLKGTILGSQAALKAMRTHGGGHIINILSTAALRGVPTETVYCAAKWGARGFTQGLREEAATHGIRVTAVLPGGVDTEFWNDAVTRSMPVQDFLTPVQVADAVIALLKMPETVVPQELILRAIRDRDFAH